MLRRSFLKSAGAALLVPNFYVARPAERLPKIDLLDFCEADPCSTRYKLDQPFRQGGMTFATDGRICLRTSLVYPDKSDEEGRLPPVDTLDWSFDRNWKPLPPRVLVASRHRFNCCPVCYWKGRLGPEVKECSVCGGEGGRGCPANCRSGYTGGVVCEYCDGRGSVRAGVPCDVRIGDLTVMAKYDAKLRRLENVEYAIEEIRPVGGVDRGRPIPAIRFRCTGADGLLMPLMPDA